MKYNKTTLLPCIPGAVPRGQCQKCHGQQPTLLVYGATQRTTTEILNVLQEASFPNFSLRSWRSLIKHNQTKLIQIHQTLKFVSEPNFTAPSCRHASTMARCCESTPPRPAAMAMQWLCLNVIQRRQIKASCPSCPCQVHIPSWVRGAVPLDFRNPIWKFRDGLRRMISWRSMLIHCGCKLAVAAWVACPLFWFDSWKAAGYM